MRHLVVSDLHAHPDHNNRRAEWLGKFILDVRPDVVIVNGDLADMPSLSSYDKGKKSFQGRTYRADIDAHLDFQDKLWSTVRRAKRKLPRRVATIGNHEQRIERAIELQGELDGTISYGDLELEHFYDDVVYYDGSTPGAINVGGIHYSHYCVSGVLGHPISGEHPAYSIISKQHASCAVGHSHKFDYCVRTRRDGKKLMGLDTGCFFDYRHPFAGVANDLYWAGVCVLDNVDDGTYDLKTASLASLRKEYGRSRK